MRFGVAASIGALPSPKVQAVRELPRLIVAGMLLIGVAGAATWGMSASKTAGPVPSSGRQDPAGATGSDEAEALGWVADVDAFTAYLEATHPEPYHSIAREEFMAEVAAFKTDVPELSEWEARARFMNLLALLTRDGQDGHMVLRPMDTQAVTWRMLPLEVHWFADGFYVVAAHSDDVRGAVGSKLVAIGGTPVADVVETLQGVVTKDNEWTVKARVPTMMMMPDVLDALGVANATSLEVMKDGSRTTIELEPISIDEYLERSGRMHPFITRLPARPGHMWLAKQDESIWARYLRRQDTLYVGFNLVRAPFDGVISTIQKIMEERRPERVVIDIRNNPGGETGHYAPLVRALSDPPVDRPGRLFVLTGRVTFSAAANFLGDLDKDACALVVGEPPGAAPRFWNDNDPFTLPASGLQVGVAERWWDQGGAEHPGTVFSVDVPVRQRSRDYFAGRDAVLDAALRHPVGDTCS